jgi:diphosphomevalonate decarboxylase
MFISSWKSPSNIAFIKYWGKLGNQIPANPSLSMTLSECYTQTKVQFEDSPELIVEVLFNGEMNHQFSQKILSYLTSLPDLRLQKVKYIIETKNSFPHGTGIASSASGMSAFALCLTDFLYFLDGLSVDDHFFSKASHLSRLGSGSACRSIYGGFTTWGKSHLSDSSDEVAIPLGVHPFFKSLKDSVLVLDDQEKRVSSTAGHHQMKDHLFSEARFSSAKINFKGMVDSLKAGDWEVVGKILEKEAYQLHAMMMTSPEPYFLMRPQTLSCIELITDFRNQTHIPLYFTLDAGPNLHLIYPESFAVKILTFIEHELLPLSKKVIHDFCGQGPVKCL